MLKISPYVIYVWNCRFTFMVTFARFTEIKQHLRKLLRGHLRDISTLSRDIILFYKYIMQKLGVSLLKFNILLRSLQMRI